MDEKWHPKQVSGFNTNDSFGRICFATFPFSCLLCGLEDFIPSVHQAPFKIRGRVGASVFVYTCVILGAGLFYYYHVV